MMAPVIGFLWFWASAMAFYKFLILTAVMTAASMGIAYAMRPKGGGTEGSLDLSMFPTIGNHKFPVIWGTVRLDGPNTAWSGDLGAASHHKDDVVVFTSYVAGAVLCYCQGPVDGCKMLFYGASRDGKVCWPAADDATTLADDGLTSGWIFAPTLFGGPYSGGGIMGNISILLGTSTQARNAYLVSRVDPAVPAFRGLASIVCEQIMWGQSQYPMVLAAMMKRVLVEGDGDERWYIAKAAINTLDINPAHLLRECFTNDSWGEHMAESQLGDTWTTVADTLYDEGFGISYWYVPEPGNLKKVISEVLDVIDGVIYDDPYTGLLEIMLVRDDYEASELPVFTERDFQIENFARMLWRNVPGHIILKFCDRIFPEADAQVSSIDNAIIDKQGRSVPEELDYPMICDSTLAATVVNRKGRAMTALPAMLELKCKRIMSGLHQGSVFKITYDDPTLPIASMIVRVVGINYGGSENQSLTMTVIEDVYKQSLTTMGAGATGWTETVPTTEIVQTDTITATQACSATFDSTAPA
ncbi:MAG: hypothetical protein ABFE01_26090 [Phycisphaerales bacterium]